MGIGRRLGMPSLAAVLGLLVAIPAATFGMLTATAAPGVVLGSSPGGGSVGYGTERPRTISLGSCDNAMSHIGWDSWGGPTGHGTGTACAQTGPAHLYDLVASDIGNRLGVTAYRVMQIGTNDPRGISC